MGWDVAEPDEEGEEDGVEAAEAGELKQVVADARGVDDVESEERNPAEQKHACISSRNRIIIIIIIIIFNKLKNVKCVYVHSPATTRVGVVDDCAVVINIIYVLILLL